MITDDSVTPAERLHPFQQRYPSWIAVLALLLLVYGLTDTVTRWGERVEFKITRNCGI